MPFMLSPTTSIPRAPGMGTFTCCSRSHVMTDADGNERTVPCDKDKIGSVVCQMFEKRREYLLGSGKGSILFFRMWSALMLSCMQGLSQIGATPPPATVTDFLTSYRFDGPHDDEHVGSGFSPLIICSVSGNVPVIRELIVIHNANVNARILVDDLNADFGIEKGFDALALGASCAPQQHVHGVVSVLLEAGADPNSRSYVIGMTPLIGAVLYHNLGGVRALLACGKLDLEIPLRVNHATALNIAAVISTFEILEALILAGADRKNRYESVTDKVPASSNVLLPPFHYRNDNGGFLLTDIAHNPISDPSWFELACNLAYEGSSSIDDINAVQFPRSSKWKTISFVARMAWYLGISRTAIVTGLAHDNGGTPLSCAARDGNVKLVRWLLYNGALKSAESKNCLGSSPLDLSRIFGPHLEVRLE